MDCGNDLWRKFDRVVTRINRQNKSRVINFFFQGRRGVGFHGEISSDLRERFIQPANLSSVARRLIITEHTTPPFGATNLNCRYCSVSARAQGV